MNYPKISIVTIVLNGEKTIERCIKSIIYQNYPNLEYIVLDGGSKDQTNTIIKKYSNKIHKYKSEKDGGIADAFNKGIQLAEGEIIGIINSDDWLEDGVLIKIAKNFTHDIEILYGKINQVFPKETIVAYADHNLLTTRMTVNHPAVFVRRDVYHRMGYFNLNFKIAMDYEWLLRCYCKGIKFKFVDLIITNMEMDGCSMRQWKKGIKEVKVAKDMHINKPFKTKFEYYHQILFTYVSLKLQGSPLKSILNFYRQVLSPVKKQIINS